MIVDGEEECQFTGLIEVLVPFSSTGVRKRL
jgi:hypothetical protein